MAWPWIAARLRMGRKAPIGGTPLTLMDVHNNSVPTCRDRLCANTDPQRDSIFTKGPADALDHATSGIAVGSKSGIDATKKLPGEGFKRPGRP